MIYGAVVRVPELRQQVLVSAGVVIGNQVWLQQAVVIENKGVSDSKNLRIITRTAAGSIVRYRVVSEEIYTIDQASDNTKLIVNLPRLAPNMIVAILLLVQQATGVDSVGAQTTAVYDGGVVAPAEELTSADEMRAWQQMIGTGVLQLQQRLDQFGIDQLVAQANETLAETPALASSIGFFGLATIDARATDPAAAPALLVVLLILLTALFFFGWEGIHVAGAILTGLFLWLFTDFYVSVLWFIPAMLIALLIGNKSRLVWVITALVALLLATSITATEMVCPMQERRQYINDIFMCIPVLAPGGLLVTYVWLSLFFSWRRSTRSRATRATSDSHSEA